MIPAFPKPSQVRKKPEAVKVMRDGREVCNLNCTAGREEYFRRRRVAWETQGKICALCGLRLNWKDAVSDHKEPRGMGGGSRDDRQENIQAVHGLCNTQKGSRRLNPLLDDFVL